MRMDNFDVIAPGVLGGEASSAEILGAAVWLWMHSEFHRDLALESLPTVLLPIIEKQQYMLVSEQGKPIFFLSWMWMDEEAEHRYLDAPGIMTQERDWFSGSRLWLRDWVAPFGHTQAMKNLVTGYLFPENCMRALYHRGVTRGKCVKNFRGDKVSQQQANDWRTAHPLMTSIKELPARTQP